MIRQLLLARSVLHRLGLHRLGRAWYRFVCWYDARAYTFDENGWPHHR